MRARGLTGHYLGKAMGVDQNYGGVRPGEEGIVERKLETSGEVRGLVFGAVGEVSEGVRCAWAGPGGYTKQAQGSGLPGPKGTSV